MLAAWLWGAAGFSLWCGCWTLTFLCRGVPPGLADQFWYLAALILLCATVSVLGAKLPGARVWGGFVVFPLLLVLGWPALHGWRSGWPPERLVLPEPACLAFGFICCMGFGNYFGTRFGISAVLMGAALLESLIPLSGGRAEWMTDADWHRSSATALLVAAIWIPWLRAAVFNHPDSRNQRAPLDRVWRDFRDYYGIVWGQRIQNRFNASSVTLSPPARLEQHGLQSPAPSSPGDSQPDFPSDSRQSPEALLRWLLRRFVTTAWFDRRFEDSI